MPDFISVRVLSLRDIFSGEFEFRLPWFQRAYAWKTKEVGRLLADLFEAMGREGSKRRYFLGNIMLAKQPDLTETALVDGHQRIMTLTILFAVLRDLEPDAQLKKGLHAMIAGSDPGHRLVPQEAIRSFVERYVQEPGGTALEPDEDFAELSETERNIVDNRDYLREELGRDLPPMRLRELALFLNDHCYITVSIVGEEDEAWHFLQIEEDTRHRFDLAAGAKSSLLGMVPPAEREPCRRVWERCEHDLGSEDMFGLLAHLRALKMRKLSDKPVDTELAQIARLNREAVRFMERDLAPAARRLAQLRKGEVGRGSARSVIGDSIRQMSWIEPHLWVPAAMLWLEKRGEDGETPLFFSRLERLMWILRIAGYDPTRQQRLIFRLMGEIERGKSVAEMTELDISKSLRTLALASLRVPTFDSRRYAARVLRRASLALGQDPGPIDPEACTIEHILPSGWLDRSGWRTEFKAPDVVRTHAHRLGNLTFLSGADNRSADSKDWRDKRAIYSRSSFVMSQDAARATIWNIAAIEERTERLIKALFTSWGVAL